MIYFCRQYFFLSLLTLLCWQADPMYLPFSGVGFSPASAVAAGNPYTRHIPNNMQGNSRPAPTSRPSSTRTVVRGKVTIPRRTKTVVARPASHNAAVRINQAVRAGRNRGKGLTSPVIIHRAAAIMQTNRALSAGPAPTPMIAAASGSDGTKNKHEEREPSNIKEKLVNTKSGQAMYEKSVLLSINADQKTLALIKRQGLQVKESLSLSHLGITVTSFTVSAGQDVAHNVHQLRDKGIDVVTLNHYYTLDAGSKQKHSPISVPDMASSSWPLPCTYSSGRNISIGMVDGPVDIHQPLLKNQKIIHKSFISVSFRAHNDHGTTMAKLLVGQPTTQFSGLIPKARLYAANAFACPDETTPKATVLAILQSLDWLMEQRVQVINLSFSGPDNNLLRLAVRNILAKGVPIIAAAGNHGPEGPTAYPGAYEGVIAITAIDRYLRPYRHANQGKYISFAGPGVRIPIPGKNGKISYKSGTSFAAPYYTALIAAILSRQPSLRSISKLVPVLAKYAVDLGAPGRDPVYGWGLVSNITKCDLPLLSQF